MKTEGEIHHKLQQVRFRHLKRELEARLVPDPENCKHWTDLSMCRLQNGPCHRNPNNALKCGVFEQTNDKATLKEGMKEFFRTRPAAEIAVRFPDVAALMWVLDGSVPTEVFPEEFREKDLKDKLANVEALLVEATTSLAASKDENIRLKASLYDNEERSFIEVTTRLKDLERERETLIQGYERELAILRGQNAIGIHTAPWYRRLFE